VPTPLQAQAAAEAGQQALDAGADDSSDPAERLHRWERITGSDRVGDVIAALAVEACRLAETSDLLVLEEDGAQDFEQLLGSACPGGIACELDHCRSWGDRASRLLLVNTTNGDVVRIFIAGASGAIGSQLVPQLVARGHEVVGTTRSAAKTGALRALGAEPVIVDALDPDSVADVVAKAEPEVIVHQLTALNGPASMRHAKRAAAATNRLRTEGTDHLLAAARAVGVRKFVAQSNSLGMERTGGPVGDESGRIEPNTPTGVAGEGMAALRHVEDAVTGITWADGIAIRYGAFYGPGTGVTGPVMAELISKRRFPIVGGGGGVWSLVHITDAASVTVAAIERGKPGIYHAADDEPAPVHEWLPVLARALGAKPPRRVPAWLARLLAGKGPVDMMTQARGISTEKTKRELDWTPQYPSWRTGFTDALR
jgi:nucleoside-diphosphate-sugar epimerase